MRGGMAATKPIFYGLGLSYARISLISGGGQTDGSAAITPQTHVRFGDYGQVIASRDGNFLEGDFRGVRVFSFMNRAINGKVSAAQVT
jgi:hypothetical protein